MMIKLPRRRFLHLATGAIARQFGKFIADETEKWAKVVRAAKIKVD